MSHLREPLKLKVKFKIDNCIFFLAATDIIDPATEGPIAMIRCYDLAIKRWISPQSFSVGPKGSRHLTSLDIAFLPNHESDAYYWAEYLYYDR